MKEELSVLIEILEAQRTLQTALVELSERKTTVIGRGDGEELQRIVDEEREILSRLGAVEKKQSRCAGRLASLLGVPEPSVRMSLILERAEGEQKATLTALREELTRLIERQQRNNDVNMKLLKMNMDYVHFLINTVSKQEDGPTYGNEGNVLKGTGSVRRLLDRKV